MGPGCVHNRTYSCQHVSAKSDEAQKEETVNCWSECEAQVAEFGAKEESPDALDRKETDC